MRIKRFNEELDAAALKGKKSDIKLQIQTALEAGDIKSVERLSSYYNKWINFLEDDGIPTPTKRHLQHPEGADTNGNCLTCGKTRFVLFNEPEKMCSCGYANQTHD
jgi:hypothetical protein